MSLFFAKKAPCFCPSFYNNDPVWGIGNTAISYFEITQVSKRRDFTETVLRWCWHLGITWMCSATHALGAPTLGRTSGNWIMGSTSSLELLAECLTWSADAPWEPAGSRCWCWTRPTRCWTRGSRSRSTMSTDIFPLPLRWYWNVPLIRHWNSPNYDSTSAQHCLYFFLICV